jgi:hypothetical protein
VLPFLQVRSELGVSDDTKLLLFNFGGQVSQLSGLPLTLWGSEPCIGTFLLSWSTAILGNFVDQPSKLPRKQLFQANSQS